jgi:site-specific recombinase XerD
MSGAPRIPAAGVEALLAAAQGPTPRDRANRAMLHALALGLRPCEVERLTLRNLEQRALLFKGAKTGHPRTVPLDALQRGEAARRALLDHAAETGAGPDDPLVQDERGGAMRPVQQWRRLRTLARAAGLSGRTCPYGLRKAAARGFADRGAPLAHVAALLGHRQTGTTLRYYYGPADGDDLLAFVEGR